MQPGRTGHKVSPMGHLRAAAPAAVALLEEKGITKPPRPEHCSRCARLQRVTSWQRGKVPAWAGQGQGPCMSRMRAPGEALSIASSFSQEEGLKQGSSPHSAASEVVLVTLEGGMGPR